MNEHARNDASVLADHDAAGVGVNLNRPFDGNGCGPGFVSIKQTS
jgi:hypothetical protein